MIQIQGPGGHGLGLQGPRGSRVRPTGSQGVKGEVSGVPKDQQRQHGCVGPPEVVQEVLVNLKIGNLASVKHLTDSTSAANGRQISKSEERVGVSDR